MRKPKKLFLIVACVVAAGVLVRLRSDDNEPRYQDRPLSYWVYTRVDPDDVASVAIGRIGTNAVPWLLKWLAYEPSRLRKALAALHTRRWIPNWVSTDAAQARAEAATFAFEPLGWDGRSAIPALGRLARSSKSVPSSRATVALSFIGPVAFPALLQIAADTSATAGARFLAMREIGGLSPYNRLPDKLGTNVILAVPMLTENLRDKDECVVSAAADALGALKTDPIISVPALAKAMEDPRSVVRGSAANALGRFQDKARPALPSLIKALADSDIGVRICATNSIAQIAPEAITNVPAQ